MLRKQTTTKKQAGEKNPMANVKWLEAAAQRIEADAKAALPAWVITGRGHRYCEDMGRAAAMREAAQMSGVRARRDFLRSVGIPC